MLHGALPQCLGKKKEREKERKKEKKKDKTVHVQMYYIIFKMEYKSAHDIEKNDLSQTSRRLH